MADAERTWAERMARYRDSDLTVADFCDREGVSVAGFYHWKRRLSRPDRPALIPIELADARPAAPVEIRMPSGAVLCLNGPVDEPWLRTLLAALGHAGC